MAKKAKKYFGQPMYVGVYMLGEFVGLVNEKGDIQNAVKYLEKNTLKCIPILIQAGVNSYNEIEGISERINLLEAIEIFEKKGLKSPDMSRLLEDFMASLKVDNPEKKNKPKAVKPKK